MRARKVHRVRFFWVGSTRFGVALCGVRRDFRECEEPAPHERCQRCEHARKLRGGLPNDHALWLAA